MVVNAECDCEVIVKLSQEKKRRLVIYFNVFKTLSYGLLLRDGRLEWKAAAGCGSQMTLD